MPCHCYHSNQHIYCNSAQLFVDDFTIFSQEGTTQGDTFAMSMYEIATLPLIHRLNDLIAPQANYGMLTMPQLLVAYLTSDPGGRSLSPMALLMATMPIHPIKTWLVTKEVHLSNSGGLRQAFIVDKHCSTGHRKFVYFADKSTIGICFVSCCHVVVDDVHKQNNCFPWKCPALS